jgi:diguanylate cyclase (GGDEF)-like protein
MGHDLKKRYQIFVALLRIAADFYAFLVLRKTLLNFSSNFQIYMAAILVYPWLTDIFLFFPQEALLWFLFVLDSLVCFLIILSHNPFLLPLFLLPPLLLGFSKKHFKLYVFFVTFAAQLLFFLYFFQEKAFKGNQALLDFFAGMILVNVAAIFLSYVLFRSLKEAEQSKSLLDLIQIGQQMGASLNYEKVSALLMNVLTSMFNAHSYGLYVVEEKEGEKLAFIKGVVSPYSNLFLDFNLDTEDALFAQVLKEKKLRIIGNLRQFSDRLLPQIRTFKGALLAPVCFEDEALGLIFLVASTENAFSKEDASLLTLLSNQFAVTLKNVLLYQQTATMAVTDSLTGLYTHGFFQDQLIKQVAEHKYNKKPLSVMILDVDHFKLINDRYGHPQGDYILRQLAGLVKNTVRPKDFVCRYGGDEFVLIVPGLDRLSAATYAERIRKAVEDYQFVAGGKIAHISISAGVSSFPETAETPKELIECADKALYEAKNRGRNRIVYL